MQAICVCFWILGFPGYPLYFHLSACGHCLQIIFSRVPGSGLFHGSWVPRGLRPGFKHPTLNSMSTSKPNIDFVLRCPCVHTSIYQQKLCFPIFWKSINMSANCSHTPRKYFLQPPRTSQVAYNATKHPMSLVTLCACCLHASQCRTDCTVCSVVPRGRPLMYRLSWKAYREA